MQEQNQLKQAHDNDDAWQMASMIENCDKRRRLLLQTDEQ
jgi:hypothetical protein